jgi:hypothetical protein
VLELSKRKRADYEEKHFSVFALFAFASRRMFDGGCRGFDRGYHDINDYDINRYDISDYDKLAFDFGGLPRDLFDGE